MGRGQERPMTVGRRMAACAIVSAATGIWIASATAQDTPMVPVGPVAGTGAATTMTTALVQAYGNNPQLNAQRSAARAVDENVAIALGGYRPRVTGTASVQQTYLETLSRTLP